MSEWREVKLGDVADLIMGQSPKSIYYNNHGEGMKFLQGNRTFGKKYPTFDTYTTKITKEVEKNDILFTVRAPVGDINIANDSICIGRGLAGIRAKENQDFLYYSLIYNTKRIRMTENGTTYGSINKTDLENFKIKLPNLETQRKIANVLSTYDKLIENNNRRIEILEQTAEELYKEWFVRMRFPGYEKTKFHKGIPEGWEVKKLNEFSELVQGYTEKANDNPVGPKYLRGTDINKKSYITWSEVPYCTINETNYKKHKLQIEDIVIIRMADPGKVAVIEENVEAVFASYLIKINYDKSKVLPYYLFYTLYGKGYQSQIQSYANGTTRSSINSKMILNSSVLLPPKEIQMLFNERVLKYRKLLNQFINQNQNLIKQRDLLLPRLMNGTIIVK